MDVQLWQYDQAPPNLKELARESDPECWFALIQTDAAEECAVLLADLWTGAGYRVGRYAAGVNCVLLTARRDPVS